MCITVVVVSWHSRDWIRLLVQNLTSKAANPQSIRFLLIDNTGGNDAALRDFAEHSECRVRVVDHDASGLQRSISHASGLNRAIREVDTEFTLTCDPDIHVFLKDWDLQLTHELQNGSIAVGAAYPSWKLGKYHDFPSPIFCFMRSRDAIELGADWYPFPESRLTRLRCYWTRQVVRLGGLATRKNVEANRALRTVAGLLERAGGICEPDTGYRMCLEARKQRRLSTCLNAKFPDDSVVSRLPSSWQEMARQYELYFYRGEPAIAHKYNSSVWLWQTPRGSDSKYFLKCIESCESAQPT